MKVRLGEAACGNASESAYEIFNRCSTLDPVNYTQGWGGSGRGRVIIRSHNATANKTESAQLTLEMIFFQTATPWLDIPLTTILLSYALFYP